MEIQLGGRRRHLAERHLALELTDAAEELLANEGYDPAYGARPLTCAIQRRSLDPLARAVLRGEFREGESVVNKEDGRIVFRMRIKVNGGTCDGPPTGSPAAQVCYHETTVWVALRGRITITWNTAVSAARGCRSRRSVSVP